MSVDAQIRAVEKQLAQLTAELGELRQVTHTILDVLENEMDGRLAPSPTRRPQCRTAPSRRHLSLVRE